MVINPSLKRLMFIMISVVLVAGSLVCFGALIKPTYEEVMSKRSSLTNRSNLVEENKSISSKMKSMLTEYQKSEALLTTVSSIIPEDPDTAQSINQVATLAKINGLTLEVISSDLLAIKPGDSKTDFIKRIGTIRLDFRVAGSYENFKAFLQTIETNINLMDINSIRLTQSGGRMVYTMSIDAYYQAD
jgi:Tfp pilus assembly protein PilO